jgi:glycerol uptake facilitator-like aquaporin
MGFDVARRFEGRMVAPYLLSQCLGAILASITLRLMFPASTTLGANGSTASGSTSWRRSWGHRSELDRLAAILGLGDLLADILAEPDEISG